jgi:hypothetical protein
MAGTIVADTLQDGAGNSTAMDNAIYGSAKAWVNFNGTGGTIRASYNVSSVTVNSTGNFSVNFTNALSNANYCPNISFGTNAGALSYGYMGHYSTSTTVYRFVTADSSTAAFNPVMVTAAIFSN